MAPFPERRAGKLTGWFSVDVRTKDGKRFRTRLETLDAANGYEAYVRATGVEPPWVAGKEPTGPTFRVAAAACKADGGPKGKWKRGRDRSLMQRLDYVVMRFGDVPLAEFTTETFDMLAEGLEDRPNRAGDGTLTGDTVNRYMTAASAVLTYASTRPKLYGRFTAPMVPWRPKATGKLMWFTEPQEDAVCRLLTEAGHPDIALCIRGLAATGLRVGELLALEPADVENEWVRLWKTKTDRPRSVPIDPPLARDLRALIGSGNVPKYHAIYAKLKWAVGKCGYSDELSVHSLRHTTATRLIQRGVNPVVVQRFLGHASITTTMRYVHVQDEDLLLAAKKLMPTARANAAQSENIEHVVAFPVAKTA